MFPKPVADVKPNTLAYEQTPLARPETDERNRT